MKTNWIAWAAIVLVAGAIVAAFVTVGSPARQRAMRFDERRVNDLMEIQSQIQNYWSRTEALPQNLSDLTSGLSGYVVPKDPETKSDYEYVVKQNLSFQLCANFALETLYDDTQSRAYYDNRDSWKHSAGRFCFDRTADPQLDNPFPPTKPIPPM